MFFFTLPVFVCFPDEQIELSIKKTSFKSVGFVFVFLGPFLSQPL